MRSTLAILPAALLGLSLVHCSGPPSGSTVLTAELPLHLEEHLDAATIIGSEVPADGPESIVWRFDEPQPDWITFDEPRPLRPAERLAAARGQTDSSGAAPRNPRQDAPADDALRLVIDADRVVGVYTDFPGLPTLEADQLVVRVRTRTAGSLQAVVADLGEGGSGRPWQQRSRDIFGLFQIGNTSSPMIADGTVQSYLLPMWGAYNNPGRGDSCCRFGVMATTYEPGSVDILSVTVVSRGAAFAGDRAGVMTAGDWSNLRRTLFTHTPGRVAFTVRVPRGGRLDVGLRVVQDDAPVDFTVTVAPSGQQEEATVLQETLADPAVWAQRSVDLSAFEGQTVTLALEADAGTPGTVALWAAPTVTGSQDAGRPNVVFYIIDGGSAEHMSVYGYNRRTTPNLEPIAAEGAVFEQAYSNATWTRVSTPSFMTGLQHSVLGAPDGGDPLPTQVVTMAEHMHRGGYQTAVFTANAYAGRMSSLDRGVDLLWTEDADMNYSASSAWLHEAFWDWREAYPGQPYWVHFQPVDPHRPWQPVAPFTGLFGSVDAQRRLADWDSRLRDAGMDFERAGVDLMEYVGAKQALYDEGLAHNDYQIGRLVNRLKAAGEWANTIFIVAADHSYDNAGVPSMASMAAPFQDEQAIFSPWESRIPMIVVWPGRIAAGQRFSQPVSMIDMLPTIVDLAGLPMPEITQGQSLAPLLLGREGWEPRPVIFDEFYRGLESDTLRGRIDVVDGRWGASLLVNRGSRPRRGRAAPLLLFDLWNDPQLSHSLHEERPDLVEHYTRFLEAQWAAHQALAQRFTRSGEGAVLTPEQLGTLRALGYIR